MNIHHDLPGFNATISSLDDFGSSIPSDGPVIIIAASFEGEPADNAINFVHALTAMTEREALSGTKFAVFGCGHRDWSTTYQRVPTLIDEKFEALGATRLLERGDADAGGEDFLEAFDVWEMKLWPVLATVSLRTTHTSASLTIFRFRHTTYPPRLTTHVLG